MTRWQTKPRWRSDEAGWLSEAGEQADRIVHRHPLAATGTLFALGVLLGCAAGLLLAPAPKPTGWERLRARGAPWGRRAGTARWF